MRFALVLIVCLLLVGGAACTDAAVDTDSPVTPTPAATKMPAPLEATAQPPPLPRATAIPASTPDAPPTVEATGRAEKPVEPSSALLPESALKARCLEGEAGTSTFAGRVRMGLGVTAGDAAVDFTLQSVDGDTYTLSGLLGTKPVLLVLGGFT